MTRCFIKKTKQLKKMENKIIDTGSDFSGVGAFDQALERLGIKQNKIFACDMDKFARQTYILNYGEPAYFPENVYDREIPKKSLDIYMTSPPCQGFSMAGTRKGSILFLNSHEFIQKNNPRFFTFENVKGLYSHDKRDPKAPHGNTFNQWLNYLGGKSINGNPVIFPQENAVPYHVYYFVLNAKNYGIPQGRQRVFIVGIRDDCDNSFQIPKPFELKKFMYDCLQNDSEIKQKFFLTEKTIKSFDIHKKRHQEAGNGFGWKVKTKKSKIALTITTKPGSRNTDNYIKYNNGRIRKLTPRECFRLMDFPDSFKWNVSDAQAYKQAGNSIPVGLLVEIISKLYPNEKT